MSNNKRKQRRSRVTQEHQSDKLIFQKKKIKDQASEIADQSKRIAEWIKQQQDPRHNQD
jgi:predicted alpha/beta superfamily hydrolase